MADYPVLDGEGATIIANEKDPAYDVNVNYPVLDGAGGEVIERHQDIRLDYGDEMVVNGGFDADTDWTKGLGWSIADGAAVGAAATGNLDQSGFVTTSGKTYLIVGRISGYVGGNLRVRFTGSANVTGAYHSGDGTFVEELVATATNSVLRIVPGAFEGRLESLSIRESV